MLQTTVSDVNVLNYFPSLRTRAVRFAPAKRGEGYQCGHIQLLAHAEVYHLYDEKYRANSKDGQGKVGFTAISQYSTFKSVSSVGERRVITF